MTSLRIRRQLFRHRVTIDKSEIDPAYVFLLRLPLQRFAGRIGSPIKIHLAVARRDPLEHGRDLHGALERGELNPAVGQNSCQVPGPDLRKNAMLSTALSGSPRRRSWRGSDLCVEAESHGDLFADATLRSATKAGRLSSSIRRVSTRRQGCQPTCNPRGTTFKRRTGRSTHGCAAVNLGKSDGRQRYIVRRIAPTRARRS